LQQVQLVQVCGATHSTVVWQGVPRCLWGNAHVVACWLRLLVGPASWSWWCPAAQVHQVRRDV
jgi:hypothetical protein